jgi:predicted nucleotidyltransferase
VPPNPELERRLSSALNGAEGVVAAYLFGSHAEGNDHRESDVDVAVLLDRRLSTPQARFESSQRLAADLASAAAPARLDLVVLNDVPPGFAARIVTRGLRLVCADPEADHAFRRDSQLRAADLEPFLRRARALKLEALGG